MSFCDYCVKYPATDNKIVVVRHIESNTKFEIYDNINEMIEDYKTNSAEIKICDKCKYKIYWMTETKNKNNYFIDEFEILRFIMSL